MLFARLPRRLCRTTGFNVHWPMLKLGQSIFPYACLQLLATRPAVQLSSVNLSLISSRDSHQWAGEGGRGLLDHVYTVMLAELGSESLLGPIRQHSCWPTGIDLFANQSTC